MSTTNTTSLGAFSRQYAVRDLPGETKLKYRDTGQAAPTELRSMDKKSLRKDLEDRERIAANKEKDFTQQKYLSIESNNRDSKPSSSSSSSNSKHTSSRAKVSPINLDADEVLSDSSDDDDDDEGSLKATKRKAKNGHHQQKHPKNESDEEDNSDAHGSDDSDDDDSDDDDTAALMAELNRIKQERATEAAQLEAEKSKREEKVRVENILKGNPLLNEEDVAAGSSKAGSSSSSGADFKVKRRWDDDVVFKNCAKLENGNKKKDFINDTLRSEFHRKFMDRYVR